MEGLGVRVKGRDFGTFANKDMRVASQFFSGKPGFTFCLSCTFIFRNERNWMKKSARLTWLTGSYVPERSNMTTVRTLRTKNTLNISKLKPLSRTFKVAAANLPKEQIGIKTLHSFKNSV